MVAAAVGLFRPRPAHDCGGIGDCVVRRAPRPRDRRLRFAVATHSHAERAATAASPPSTAMAVAALTDGVCHDQVGVPSSEGPPPPPPLPSSGVPSGVEYFSVMVAVMRTSSSSPARERAMTEGEADEALADEVAGDIVPSLTAQSLK